MSRRPHPPSVRTSWSGAPRRVCDKTSDVLQILKRERVNLIEEISLAKAKLVKMDSAEKHLTQAPSASIEALETRIARLEKEISDRKEEIANLVSSDTAAHVEELRIMAKVVYNEERRLQLLTREAKIQLSEVEFEIARARHFLSPQAADKRRQSLRRIEADVNSKEAENEALRLELQSIQSQIKNTNKKENTDELQRLINSERQEIRKLKEQIEVATEERKQVTR